MAEEVTKVLDIEIKYGDAIDKIAQYKEAVAKVEAQEKNLVEQLKRGEISQKQYLKSTAALKIEKKEYSDQIRILNKEVSNEIKKNQESEGSLKALRAELSNATKAYDEMSRAEREGAAGKELQNHIMELSNEIKAAEYATNRFYRNVGNYPKEIIATIANTTMATGSLAKGFQAGGSAASAMGKQLLALAKNPFIIAFTALVAVVKAVADGIKNNEENADRFNIVLAPLKRTVELVGAGFQNLASILLSVVEKGSKVIAWIGEMAEKLPIVGQYVKEYNDELRDSISLEKEATAAKLAGRDLGKKEADAEYRAQQLLTKAYDKAHYTAEQRLEFLRDASKIESNIAQERENQALREFDIARRRADVSKNAEKDNEALNEAETNLIKERTRREAIQTSLMQREGRLLAQIKSEQNEITNARKKSAQEAEKAAKLVEEAKKKELKAVQDAEDALTALILDQYEKRVTQTRTQYQREIDALQERLDTEKNLTETAREAINQTIISKRQMLNETLNQMEAEQSAKMQAAADAEAEANRDKLQKQFEDFKAEWDREVEKYREKVQAEKELEDARLNAATETFSSLSKLADQFAENNKALAKMSKVLALAEIAINTGKAIASGTANAMNNPYPYNIIAVVTTVATVLANIATAISQVKSAKFAKGGTVEAYAGGGSVSGPGTGTSDSISARLSNGESVNTALSTAMFGPALSAMNQMAGGNPINGGGMSNVGEAMLARAFAAGAAMLPRPVVSVEEVTSTQRRVEVLESLATI